VSNLVSRPARLSPPRCAIILVVGALALGALLAPAAGVAAPAVTIATLSADVWPEHDDPRVLIIYRGTLSADAPLPYPLSFAIPVGAQVHAAAYRRDGQLFAAQSQTSRDGDQARVAFLVPVRDFQFEYYADVISGQPQRAFAVALVFPLLVESLQVSVEQPLRSSGFMVTPASTRTATGGGFTYYLYTEERWPAGKVWSIRGTYRKEDNNPSLPRAAPPPAAAPAPVTGGGGPLPWLLPAVIGVVIGVAGTLTVTYLRRPRASRRAPSPPPASRRDRSARRDQEPAEPHYCANCGTRAGPRDRFCSNCGRPLPHT